MTKEETVANLNATLDDLDYLIEIVMHRDAGEALEMVTMIHEIAKLYVADQLPKATVATYRCTDETLEVVFSGRNVRTAKNMLQHLKVLVDDDGIPL